MSERPAIKKSSRHSKITGDFAEHLTLYLLSKHGFECAHVDHTGMDIIARNPHTDELMGISVKSRSREEKSAGASMNIRADNFEKLSVACSAFNCQPYFAIVIDRDDKISVYILSQETLFELNPNKKDGAIVYWAMKPAAIEGYRNNPQIYRWELTHEVERWWPASARKAAKEGTELRPTKASSRRRPGSTVQPLLPRISGSRPSPGRRV